MITTSRQTTAGRIAAAGVAALVLLTATLPASARPGMRHYGHHRGGGIGPAAGAAIGLGVLGAVAAGAAASHSYNGYPVYPDGGHAGYGYDYYPDHGGYYGPY